MIQPKNGTGDTHRFGQFVKCADSCIKPRNGTLEFLFSDPNSPISPWLKQLYPTRFEYSINRISTWHTECQNLSSLAFNANNLTYAEVCTQHGVADSIAYWMVLTLAFGITDLHANNVLIIKDQKGLCHFQPIDLELIFEPTTNLVSTSLIGHSTNFFGRSGIFAQWGSDDFLYSSGFPLIAVIDRLLTLFASLDAKQLADICKTISLELKGKPVRRISRATEDYRKAILSDSSLVFENFHPEEKLQMKAGDIPYFFHQYPSPEIRYFNSVETHSVVKSQLDLPAKMDITFVCNPERLENLKKITTLQLLRRFWPTGQNMVLSSHFKAVRKDQLLILETASFRSATNFLPTKT